MHSNPASGDLQTFRRMRSGDQRALKELYYAFYEKLTRTAYNITQDTAAAEDIAQQTFIELWVKRAEVEVRTDVYAYLRRMTVNAAIAHMRKTARRATIRSEMPETAVVHTDPEDGLSEKELRREINVAVNNLPGQCREVFKLSRYEEMTYREIADTLGISPKTVENHMGKALKLLRQALQRYLHSMLL